jgi:hypothetical protein
MTTFVNDCDAKRSDLGVSESSFIQIARNIGYDIKESESDNR